MIGKKLVFEKFDNTANESALPVFKSFQPMNLPLVFTVF